MTFDKNQKVFPSKEHNAIWNLGIHVLPLEVTLPLEVRNSLPSYLVESSVQLREFLLHLLGDMYDEIELYLPLPYQLSRKILRPFIDFGLLGEAEEDNLTINRLVFNKYIKKLIKSKDYDDDKNAGISMEYRFNLLERVGLKIEYLGDSVIFTNALYPNMFYALQEMAIATSYEKASGDNNFTYCDFRRLCKDYKYDKYENALIYLNDEQKELAKQLDVIAKKLKLTRSIRSGHCAGYGVEYNYQKANLLNLNCLCSYYEKSLNDNSNNHKNNNILLQIRLLYDEKNPAPMHNFWDAIENDSDELKKFVYGRIKRCRVCYYKCPTYGGRPLQIYGKTNKICLRVDCALKLELIVIGPTKRFIAFTSDELSLIERTLIYAKKLTDEML